MCKLKVNVKDVKVGDAGAIMEKSISALSKCKGKTKTEAVAMATAFCANMKGRM